MLDRETRSLLRLYSFEDHYTQTCRRGNSPYHYLARVYMGTARETLGEQAQPGEAEELAVRLLSVGLRHCDCFLEYLHSQASRVTPGSHEENVCINGFARLLISEIMKTEPS